MRNRAKCKLCESIIESFHTTDYVSCKCDEIAVDGGQSMRCYAKDFKNFIRLDGDDKEVLVQVVEKEPEALEEKVSALDAIHHLRRYYEDLDPQIMSSFVTHYDLLSVLLLVEAVCKEDS